MKSKKLTWLVSLVLVVLLGLFFMIEKINLERVKHIEAFRKEVRLDK